MIRTFRTQGKLGMDTRYTRTQAPAARRGRDEPGGPKAGTSHEREREVSRSVANSNNSSPPRLTVTSFWERGTKDELQRTQAAGRQHSGQDSVSLHCKSIPHITLQVVARRHRESDAEPSSSQRSLAKSHLSNPIAQLDIFV
jgi:hypothetical protein